MKVAELMSKDLVTVSADTRVTATTQAMRNKRSSCVVVVSEGRKPVGIVTENDFVVRVLSVEKNPQGTSISEIMSEPLIHVAPETSVLEAIGIMHEKNFSQLPVLENGQLVGLVRLADLMQYLVGFFSAHRW